MTGEDTSKAAWSEVSRNAYWAVFVDRALQIVAVRRTNTPLVALSEIDVSAAGIEPVYRFTGPRWRLLVDLRDAPMRNDPAFEQRMKPIQDRLLGTYRKTAVLVRTAVGRLQVLRTRGDDDGRARQGVFLEEDEAVAYLVQSGAGAL